MKINSRKDEIIIMNKQKANSQKPNAMRILMSGGGTGGHIFPAIAIAQEIQKDFPMQNFYSLGQTKKWKWKKFRRQVSKLKV